MREVSVKDMKQSRRESSMTRLAAVGRSACPLGSVHAAEVLAGHHQLEHIDTLLQEGEGEADQSQQSPGTNLKS